MNSNGKRLLAGVFTILILSVSAYFLARGTSSSHHERVDTPRADTADSINPTPGPVETTGTKSAEISQVRSPETSAHTAFRKSYHCYYKLNEIAMHKKRADCSFFEGKPIYEKAYASCIDSSLNEQKAAAAARASMAGCPNDEGATLRDYYNATKAAARDGDADAQLCYLASYFEDAQGKSHYTDKDVEEYKVVAPEYVSQAFKRGDWRIVYLLSTRDTGATRSLLTLLDDIGQPETIYKMNKLLRLGATGDYAEFLDGTMRGYVHPDALAKGDALPEHKVVEADKWAEETYDEYFAGQNPLNEAPAICRPRDEVRE